MQLVVIAHNIRSIHNVGSIFRTADSFGVAKLYLTGYTPYPNTLYDDRPPHIRDKITRQIHKTALNAETSVPFEHQDTPEAIIQSYRARGFTIAALEQASRSIALTKAPKANKLLLLLGEERYGITADLLEQCDVIFEIPMKGTKESLNVSVATGIALYSLTNSL